MCAIVGWAGRAKRGQWPLVHALLTELLSASACRGIDATGFAALDRNGVLLVDKEPMPSRVFTRISRSWRDLSSPKCVVAHCRAATHGSPFTADNRNNHPFVGKGLAVVVNGITPNYVAVARQRGLRLRSECDSEVLLRIIENATDPATGLRTCLDLLEGGFATAVLDADRGQVWLAHNEARPLWLLRIRGIQGWFACSTREIAEQALSAVFGKHFDIKVESLIELASGSVVGATADGRLLTSSKKRLERTLRGLILR